MALFALEINNVLDFVHPAVATLEKNLAALSSQKVMKFGGMSNGVGQMVTNVTRMAKPVRLTCCVCGHTAARAGRASRLASLTRVSACVVNAPAFRKARCPTFLPTSNGWRRTSRSAADSNCAVARWVSATTAEADARAGRAGRHRRLRRTQRTADRADPVGGPVVRMRPDGSSTPARAGYPVMAVIAGRPLRRRAALLATGCGSNAPAR